MKNDAAFIRRKMGVAICDYRMIDPGDRILLGVSGGKDSLCLLDMLLARQEFSPVKYELIPVHFNNNRKNAKVLKAYLEARGIKCLFIPQPKVKKLKDLRKSACFNCSWERRKFLFQAATELNCNKIAFAHHQDDIIETTLMNLFMLGEISTMSPNQSVFDGRIRIIRPLAYVPETAIVSYARDRAFPELPDKCAYSETSNRAFMSEIIDQVEKRCKDVRKNIFWSTKRIRKEYLL